MINQIHSLIPLYIMFMFTDSSSSCKSSSLSEKAFLGGWLKINQCAWEYYNCIQIWCICGKWGVCEDQDRCSCDLAEQKAVDRIMNFLISVVRVKLINFIREINFPTLQLVWTSIIRPSIHQVKVLTQQHLSLCNAEMCIKLGPVQQLAWNAQKSRQKVTNTKFVNE